jgi:hypothetical protein
MSEFFREIQRRRAEQADGVSSAARPARLGGLVIVLGVLALGLFVAASVSRSVVGVIGGLIVSSAALCWWQSDRKRPDPTSGVAQAGDPDDADDMDAHDSPPDFGPARWALLSITAFLVGLATFGVGMIRGW